MILVNEACYFELNASASMITLNHNANMLVLAAGVLKSQLRLMGLWNSSYYDGQYMPLKMLSRELLTLIGSSNTSPRTFVV